MSISQPVPLEAGKARPKRVTPLMVAIASAIALRVAIYVAALPSDSDWSRALAPNADELSQWWSHLSAHAGNAIASLQVLVVLPWFVLVTVLFFKPNSESIVRRVFIASLVACVALWLFVAAGIALDGNSDPSLEWG